MSDGLTYTLITNWSRAGEGAALNEGLSRLKPEERFLLLSDGSLTLELELLSGPLARVEAEVETSETRALSAEAAAFLEEDPQKAAMHRGVWLAAGQKRLVYAQTLIPLDRIEKNLLNALESDGNVPLGRVLSARRIPICKDRLDVAVLRCPKAAEGLRLGADTPLMARRYVLFNRSASGDRSASGEWIIKAGITEIFSPGIVPAIWPI